MVGIYKIINKLDNKVYVGKSVNIENRIAKHFNVNRKDVDIHGELDRQIHIQGADNFTWEILCECNEDELNQNEAFFIALFDCCNPDKGYNMKAYDTCTNNNLGQKVIDVDTFVVYESTGHCARVLGLSQGDVVRVCNHQHFTIAGHRFQYLSEYQEHGIIERTTKESKAIRPVKCIETGEVYPSIHEAGRKMELNFRLIASVCSGIRKTTGGYHFVYM